MEEQRDEMDSKYETSRYEESLTMGDAGEAHRQMQM